jgi:hypothetical protein
MLSTRGSRPCGILLLAAAMLVPRAAPAQYMPPVWRSVTPSIPPGTRDWLPPGDSVRAGDYAMTGALAGAAVTGLLGGAVGWGFCTYDDPDASFGTCASKVVLSTLFGAVPGFVIGGMIGSTIKREDSGEALPSPAHGPRQVGSQVMHNVRRRSSP